MVSICSRKGCICCCVTLFTLCALFYLGLMPSIYSLLFAPSSIAGKVLVPATEDKARLVFCRALC